MRNKYTHTQILEMYHEWSVQPDGKISGVRFGQYCCNHHPDLHQDDYLWNEIG